MSIFSAAILGTDVIALPLTSLLMRTSPWRAIFVGNFAFAFGLITICLLGEPKRPCVASPHLESESQILAEPDVITIITEPLKGPIDIRKQIWWKVLSDLVHNRVILVLLFPILCNALVSGIPDLLVIYVEKRLGWSISQVHMNPLLPPF